MNEYEDVELKALLAGAAPPPLPSPALDARVHSLLGGPSFWRRLLFGGVRVPVPVLAMLLLALLWALLGRESELRPNKPAYSVMTIQDRGYLPVSNPTVTIVRSGGGQ